MESNNNSSSAVPKIIGGIVAVLVCCACVVIIAAGGLFFYESRGLPASDTTPFLPPIFDDTVTPLPPVFDDTATPLPPIELTRPPIDSISTDTLQTLLTSNVPENDPYELACRLEKKCDVPRTVPGKSYKVGDKENF